MYQVALNAYSGLIADAISIALVFEFGNLIVGTFLRAAFGGGLYFGR